MKRSQAEPHPEAVNSRRRLWVYTGFILAFFLLVCVLSGLSKRV